MSKRDKMIDSGSGTRFCLNDLLPNDNESKVVLDNRAALLSIEEGEGLVEDANVIHYLKFRLGDADYYGIPYKDISDVKLADNITIIPNSPDFVVGVHYWHGKIITVVDMNKFFKINLTAESNGELYIATIKNDEAIMAFIFNDIIGVDSFSSDDLQAIPDGIGKIDNKFIRGVHSGTTCVLNIKEVLVNVSERIGQFRGKRHG